jgi:F-type H+-transporting ATPase subunit a
MGLIFRRIRIWFIVIVGGFLLNNACLFANEPVSAAAKSDSTVKKEALKPGDIIFEHIGDSYYWHIVSFKDKVVSIPLLVIVYSQNSGLKVFCSSKLEHGHASYQGFEISEEGKYKGKIVEKLADGSISKPIDISITKNVLSLLFSLALMLWMFISIANRYKKRPNEAPKGMQSILEPLVIFVRDEIAIPSIGKDRYEKFMPYLLTVFFFIWINNMMGLIPIFPGGANVSGNITITMILALITFFITLFSTNKFYWVHLVNTPGVPWWLKLPIPLMPFIEFSSNIVIRPFVLMIRLFANITAGHINVLSFIMLIFIFGAMNPIAGFGFTPVSVAFVVFIYFIELLVAFIQAFVFTLLSALYFGMAKEQGHH